MKIDRAHIHPELRKLAAPLMLLNFLLSCSWGARLMCFAGRASAGRKLKGALSEERWIASRSDAPEIRIRIYRPRGHSGRLPAMLYCHGGGYMIGRPEEYHSTILSFMESRPCVIIAPDYRKSLNTPYPAALDDCYDTLLWMKENSEELKLQDNGFILSGHSAGGGLTAALSLRARDTKEVKIAFQMPLYPMIDDRQDTESAQFSGTPVWDARTNAFAWSCYLKDLRDRQENVPAYAAPARNQDHRGLPPAISFVGSLDPFRDETIRYIEALKAENIKVEFRLYAGCFHGFDQAAPRTGISKEALEFTFDSYSKFYDIYYPEMTTKTIRT